MRRGPDRLALTAWPEPQPRSQRTSATSRTCVVPPAPDGLPQSVTHGPGRPRPAARLALARTPTTRRAGLPAGSSCLAVSGRRNRSSATRWWEAAVCSPVVDRTSAARNERRTTWSRLETPPQQGSVPSTRRTALLGRARRCHSQAPFRCSGSHSDLPSLTILPLRARSAKGLQLGLRAALLLARPACGRCRSVRGRFGCGCQTDRRRPGAVALAHPWPWTRSSASASASARKARPLCEIACFSAGDSSANVRPSPSSGTNTGS